MYRKSARDLRDSYLRGQFSAEEILGYFLKRVDKCDKEIGSFLSILSNRALKQAQLIDQKRADRKPLGKLAGIPVAIKDNLNLSGELTTCASRILASYRATFTASAVRLIEEHDGIIIGKTNLDEFAMGSSTEHSAMQETKNPWNLNCVPGGSSGGSATAVAARLAPLSLGSETGGSVRQPAAFCGIVGFKPTYGRVSRYGLVAFGSSLDQISPFATNVADIALIMEVIGQHCFHDANSIELPPSNIVEDLKSDLQGIRIGVVPQLMDQLPEEIANIYQKSIELSKALGAQIIEVSFDLLKYTTAVYYILATAEAATNLARFDGIRYGLRSSQAESLHDIYSRSRGEGFGEEVKRRIMLGTYLLSSGYQDAYYRKAQKVRTLIIEELNQAFSHVDSILMPVTTCSAFEKGSVQDPLNMYLMDLFTIPANLAGLPAISIPAGFSSNNLPLGMQLLGPQMHDKEVICIAHALEQALNCSNKIPPLFDKE